MVGRAALALALGLGLVAAAAALAACDERAGRVLVFDSPWDPARASLDDDGDGLSNGQEVREGVTDPLDDDTDGDGLIDSRDLCPGEAAEDCADAGVCEPVPAGCPCGPFVREGGCPDAGSG